MSGKMEQDGEWKARRIEQQHVADKYRHAWRRRGKLRAELDEVERDIKRLQCSCAHANDIICVDSSKGNYVCAACHQKNVLTLVPAPCACPECGVQRTYIRRLFANHIPHWYIQCENPDCGSPRASDAHVDAVDAVKAWNNRQTARP